MKKYLYGRNGSKWKSVKHIPSGLDGQGSVFFSEGGNHYYNKDGTTYQMTQQGGENWNGRLRKRNASYNVYLQRRRGREEEV